MGKENAAGRTAVFPLINGSPRPQCCTFTHGCTPEDVRKDLEGLQTMRTLADNMAWLIRCIAAGKAAGVEPPTPEPWVGTHFIR